MATTTPYKPLFVRRMPPFVAPRLDVARLATEGMQTFSRAFLRQHLGRGELASGLHHDEAEDAEGDGAEAVETVPSKTYYLLDAAIDPYVPQVPGEHGAKLALFIREVDDEAMVTDVPVFVAIPHITHHPNGIPTVEPRYAYMGHYSQTRWSDKLDVERALDVIPQAVREHWAAELTATVASAVAAANLAKSIGSAEDGEGRMPGWMLEALRDAMVSPPTWLNPISDDGEALDASHTVDFLWDVRHWVADADDAISKLTKDGVLAALERADCDERPGLRFYWEYLECVAFRRNFYYSLAQAALAA